MSTKLLHRTDENKGHFLPARANLNTMEKGLFFFPFKSDSFQILLPYRLELGLRLATEAVEAARTRRPPRPLRHTARHVLQEEQLGARPKALLAAGRWRNLDMQRILLQLYLRGIGKGKKRCRENAWHVLYKAQNDVKPKTATDSTGVRSLCSVYSWYFT